MASPVSRTLSWLRKQGYVAEVTEKWNPFSRTRKDLFGLLDILALKAQERGCLGIQATSTSNLAARRTKAKQSPLLGLWLGAGNAFWLVGWAKRGARGKRKTWQVTVEVVTS